MRGLLLRHLVACCLLLFGFPLSGCGDKSAVSVTVLVQNQQITVSDGLLGAQLDASFDLLLELGPVAESSTTVTLDGVFLDPVEPADGEVPAKFSPESNGETFPISLSPGQRKVLSFVVDPDDVLTDGSRTTLCDGQVQIRGSVRDGDSPVQFAGAPFSADGC